MHMGLFSAKSVDPRGSWCLPDNDQYAYRDGARLDTSFGYHPHRSTRFRNLETVDAKRRGRLPELYARRSECCGCSACAFACPQGAIALEPDEEGFDYPVVDAAACIGCSRCIDICVFKNRSGT